MLKEGDSTGTVFKYPSYVQHIMGDIFSLGFGPFRYLSFGTAITIASKIRISNLNNRPRYMYVHIGQAGLSIRLSIITSNPSILNRWVCTSSDPEDLAKTDEIATQVLEDFIKEGGEYK